MKVKLLKKTRQMFHIEKRWTKGFGTEYRVVQGFGRECVTMCHWTQNFKHVVLHRRLAILDWVRSNYTRE